jgi:tetratricopeptide (TPR) repeat protein
MLIRTTFRKIRNLALAVFPLLLLCNPSVHAGERPAQRAERKFVEARNLYEQQPNSMEASWQFGRACFNWAEFAADDDQRESIALAGIEACRKAIEKDPDAVQGHYYLAMNLGQLARTKSIGALKLVREMEKEFTTARERDAKFDFAGPDRNLGQLYFEAPGWPTSIGSRSKARKHFENSLRLAPNYPENYLNAIEASLKWGDDDAAEREFKALKKIWPAAKKELNDDKWAGPWKDWENRLSRIQSKLLQRSKNLESPREMK